MASNPNVVGADFGTEIFIGSPPDDRFDLTGGGSYCPDVTPLGLPIGLDDSEPPFTFNNNTYNVTYQLYYDGNTVELLLMEQVGH